MNGTSYPELLFRFESYAVRVIDLDGEIWFVARDVCAIFAFSNPRQAVSQLDVDERGLHIIDTCAGPKRLTIISESGLYHLRMASRAMITKRFIRWITHDVLPVVRKQSGYEARFFRLLSTYENGQLIGVHHLSHSSAIIQTDEPDELRNFIIESIHPAYLSTISDALATRINGMANSLARRAAV